MKFGTCQEPTGIWLIDKPSGMSSFRVVAQMRRLLNIPKIGHAGTLDPLATGLMIILVGKEFTKQADSLLKLDKSYQLEITLGATTETDDAEGPLEAVSDRVPSPSEVKAAIAHLTGTILQVPPRYSALKVGGQRAYKLARQGKQPVLPARQVTIHRWVKLGYDYPILTAEVSVSSGTYIRALARSIGDILQTGAYLSALRRTEIGPYQLSQATTLEKIAETC